MENMINIRDLSIKCGVCDTYQTLSGWEPADGFNVYTYECENDACRPQATRTLLEVPTVVDLFARRHPESACGDTCGVAAAPAAADTPRDLDEKD